jgi:hypothetical protein
MFIISLVLEMQKITAVGVSWMLHLPGMLHFKVAIPSIWKCHQESIQEHLPNIFLMLSHPTVFHRIVCHVILFVTRILGWWFIPGVHNALYLFPQPTLHTSSRLLFKTDLSIQTSSFKVACLAPLEWKMEYACAVFYSCGLLMCDWVVLQDLRQEVGSMIWINAYIHYDTSVGT